MKTLLRLFVFSIGMGCLGLIGWQVFLYIIVNKAQTYYESIKDNKRVYVYDTTTGTLNSAIYVQNIELADGLIKYYNNTLLWYDKASFFDGKRKLRIVDGDTIRLSPATLSPANRYFPCNKPLILLGYADKDSFIAEVVDFNTDCWGYAKGYVYYKNLHERPAPTKMIDAYRKYWEDKERSEVNQRTQRIAKQPSPYGIQCQ